MTDRVTGWLAALAGAGALLAAMSALSAPAALAQSTETPQQARVVPPAVSAAEVAGAYDGKTLDAFARATRIVGALRNEYSPKIAAANIAGRPDRAEALFDEMRARMHDAIDATGLTIERYEAIAARAEHDRVLRARIEAIMTGVRPPVDPGLGVEAPRRAPREPVTQTEDEEKDKLATAQREVERLHRQIDAERSRARAEREQAASDAAALRASLEGAIDDLGAQMAAAASRGTGEELEALRTASVRNELARAALTREIARLARAFASAGAAMTALGDDLADRPAPDVVPLTRLDSRPLLLAGSVPSLARDLTAVQSRDALRARLDAEQTRNITLRARHASERVALRREIDRIGRDLAAATAALLALTDATTVAAPGVSEVIDVTDPSDAPDAPDAEAVAARAVALVADARPFKGADPMYDQETYFIVDSEMSAKDAPDMRFDAPRQNALAHPPVPVAPVVRSGTLQAGIRAYESRDYARAYRIWRPLAEAGGASAQFHLGALYFEGRGVGRDLAAARRWLRKALDQGQERARFLLGRVDAQIAKAG